MANHPTGGQSAQRSVRLFLATGMIALIGLVVVVASGILTPGSQTGAPAPMPTPSGGSSSSGGITGEPAPTPSDTAPGPPAPPPDAVLQILIGTWGAVDDQSLVLTITPKALFLLATGADTRAGYVVGEGSSVLLLDADRTTRVGEVLAWSADRLRVLDVESGIVHGFIRAGG